MSRVYVLAEGQTEEAFVNELLVDHYARQGCYLTPIVVDTSPGHKGGVVSYAQVRPQIALLCRDAGAYVTTLFDFYRLPRDFPGRASAAYAGLPTAGDRIAFLEAQLGASIGCANFVPNLMLHEFEALLFTDVEAIAQWTDDDDALTPLHVVRAVTAPEDINEGPQTAPSKRIAAAVRGYQKPVHGPLIASDIGLDAIRAACPHFDGWLRRVETLP